MVFSSSRQDGRRMRLISLALGILILSLTIRPGPGTVSSVSTRAGEPEWDEGWYEPIPEDFRPPYDRDSTNVRKQSWDQYWRWVKVFYEGNFLSDGWTDRSKGLVSVVKVESELKKIRTAINALGREICAEWSKDYAVRKVSSADLVTWGKMLEKAKARDDGRGGEIHRTIESIRAAHQRQWGAE
jgi:hypothetical protein